MREKRLPGQRHPSNSIEGKEAFLAHSNIFRQLSAEEIHELDRITTIITCPPGRIFYRPGETGTALFLLKAGTVQLYQLSTDGRKLIIATLEAGDCFGEIPFIGQATHHCFAEAVDEVCVCLLNKLDVEQLLKRKPNFALALLQVVGQRLVQLEAQLIDATFKGTSARLAMLLLQLAHPDERDGKTLVVEGFSQEGLAEHLGVYRETVSVALRELKDSGAIELGRKLITLCDPALLKTIASS